jgi:hypothetical protein
MANRLISELGIPSSRFAQLSALCLTKLREAVRSRQPCRFLANSVTKGKMGG